jgi:hypothetical protein
MIEIKLEAKSKISHDLLAEIALVCTRAAAQIIDEYLRPFPDWIDERPVLVKVTTSTHLSPEAHAKAHTPHGCGLGSINIPFPTAKSFLTRENVVDLDRINKAVWRFFTVMAHEAAHVWDYRLHKAADPGWQYTRSEYWGWESQKRGSRRKRHRERDCEMFARDVEAYFEGWMRTDPTVQNLMEELRGEASRLAMKEANRGRSKRPRKQLPPGQLRFPGHVQADLIKTSLEMQYDGYYSYYGDDRDVYSRELMPVFKDGILTLSEYKKINDEFLYRVHWETQYHEDSCRDYKEGCSEARAGNTIYKRVEAEMERMIDTGVMITGEIPMPPGIQGVRCATCGWKS